MKICVTGAAGFIGSHVAVGLARDGHEVVGTARRPEKCPALAVVPNLRIVRLDLADRAGWDEALAGCDALVHIALGWGDTGPEMLANDTVASIHLFEACRRLGVGRIVYTSSTAANGEMTPLNGEEQQLRPLDLYGATKAATEMFARAYAHQMGLQVSIVRPGYIFGEPVIPGASTQPDRRFRDICQAVRERRAVRVGRYDGTQFLHADDLAEVYRKALVAAESPCVYYGLSAEFATWADVARMAMEEEGVDVELLEEERGNGPTPWLFDVRRIEERFGLRFGNRDRLRAHVRWQLSAL